MNNKSSKIDWMKILQVVAQAIIAALSFGCILLCLLLLEPNSNDTRDLSHDGWRYGGTQ